jgi:hypothetical protein
VRDTSQRLSAVGMQRLLEQELIAAMCYTGPMFLK